MAEAAMPGDEAFAAAGAVAATALLALLALGCRCRRPKLALAVASLWLFWLAFKFAQGHAAWDEVLAHAKLAARTTAAAAVAVWAMLRAWLDLMLPLVMDLWHGLEPLLVSAALQVAHAWVGLSVREKSMLCLFVLGICGAAVALLAVRRSLAAAWRSREAVKGVLFQLSFALLGPLIWWLATMLPTECTGVLLEVVMSVVPVLGSVRILLKLKEERSKMAAGSGAARSWFSAMSEGLLQLPQEPRRTPGDLEERARLWLSYWSCWPILMTLHLLSATLVNEQVIDEEDLPAVIGLELCLVVWAQFWNASLGAPILFVVCGRCLGSLAQRSSATIESVVGWLVAQRAKLGVFQKVLGSRWAMLAVGALVVLGLAQLFREVSNIITFACLIGVGVESARCIARNDSEMYAPRLSFWVISMSWSWLLVLPLVGGLLSFATPVILVAAFVGGETLFYAVAGMARKLHARLRDRAAGPKEPLLPAVEEEPIDEQVAE